MTTTEWVMAPREPTEEMVAAGRRYAVPSTQAIIPIYTAMLSASPVPPSEPVLFRVEIADGVFDYYDDDHDAAACAKGLGAKVEPLYAHPSPGSVLPPSPRDDVVEALRSAQRICENINEFGHVTDQEIYDAAEAKIRNALSALEPSHG